MNYYYLAYGSNLNVNQMKRRCPRAKIVGSTIIDDYRLMFKGSKTGAYLTIATDIYMYTCLEGYEDFGFDKDYLIDAYSYSIKGAEDGNNK